MCTLSVIPRDDGYYLAMNRDERIARGPAEPPACFQVGGFQAIYPRDTEGGTWIAANDSGISFALLNWNDVPANVSKKLSRGHVIPTLIASTSSQEADAALAVFHLDGLWPFRLVGVFPSEQQLREWRWNLTALESRPVNWEVHHWFSSSLSDEQASIQRGAACKSAWDHADAASLAWLRRLHASHDVERAPFSLCVHREGVETVSYTEVVCTKEEVRCNYSAGCPCKRCDFDASVGVGRVRSAR
jgi:hypothetical protein